MWVSRLFLILSCTHYSYSKPVPKILVDLTHPFDNATLHHPIHKKFTIKVALNESFQGAWVLTEEYSSGTHAGTHMDAPCHVVPGKWTVDQIPLDRLMAPAAVIDIEHQSKFNPDYQMTVKDLVNWEHKTGQVLNDVIVLVRTGWGKLWKNPLAYYGIRDMTEYSTEFLRFPGISSHAAKWLLHYRKIIGIGIDTLSLDAGQSQNLDTHKTLFEHNIYGMENLANLDKLPLYGAKLYAIPMNIKSACGAPVRAIATYPKLHSHGL